MLTLVLLCALGANVVEKPDGIAISAVFIAGIVAVSLISWVTRTTELRADRIEFDDQARQFITDSITHDGRLEVDVDDPSQFSDVLRVRGIEIDGHRAHPQPSRAQRHRRHPAHPA